MDGSRFWQMIAVTLALFCSINQTGRAQYAPPQSRPTAIPRDAGVDWTMPSTPQPVCTMANDKAGLVCRVYALRDFSDDPTLGKWIAETIPNVIQPGSWEAPGESAERRSLSYFAPGRVLVVYHTPAAHIQVEEFLKNLKNTLPRNETETVRARPQTSEPALLPARYSTVDSSRAPAVPSVNKSAAYPIPAPLQQPKHLFHMVFRYEGEGALQAAVGDLVKTLNRDSTDKEDKPSKEDAEKSDPSGNTSQLLHFIVRYEGDGIIDDNVRKFLSSWMGKNSAATDLNINIPGTSINIPGASLTPVDPARNDDVPPPPPPARIAVPTDVAPVYQPRMPMADELPQPRISGTVQPPSRSQ
jgi:hypothetical protein